MFLCPWVSNSDVSISYAESKFCLYSVSLVSMDLLWRPRRYCRLLLNFCTRLCFVVGRSTALILSVTLRFHRRIWEFDGRLCLQKALCTSCGVLLSTLIFLTYTLGPHQPISLANMRNQFMERSYTVHTSFQSRYLGRAIPVKAFKRDHKAPCRCRVQCETHWDRRDLSNHPP